MQTTLSTTTNSSAQAGNAATSVAANQNDLSDMFTKLLVAQIQNQDPMNPSDPSQYINQLAQLSQTESMNNLATLTSNNVTALQSMQMLTLGAQVGANVTVASNSVTLGNSVVQGSATLQSTSSDATLVLTGADGVQHSFSMGPQQAGDVPFAIDPATLGLPAGVYSISMTTSSGETPAIAISGKIDSVKFSSNGALLNVENAGAVTPSAIVSFNGPTATLSN